MSSRTLLDHPPFAHPQAVAATRPRPATTFTLPSDLAATAPPEVRGLARDEVRLLVARAQGIEHRRFAELGAVLEPGDLVVVNTSQTVASALDGHREGGRTVVVHVAGPARQARATPAVVDTGDWIVELRRPDASGPVLDAEPGETVTLTDGTQLRLLAPAAGPSRRLWRVRLHLDEPALSNLARVARPIAYGYLDDRYGIEAYRTVLGREPGSAVMPSAGRPFSDAMVTDLVTRGVAVAPVLLHTGVSSLEADEAPEAERYEVPAATARLVDHTRRFGGRIVAVGTTVTRALETVADRDGRVAAGAGWTDVVLGPDRPARVVDGLVTGWHEPDASHLLLLEAVAGAELVGRAYTAAVAGAYRWHEFGDSCLLLP